ncbi:MAG: hypothetical protein COY66_05535 [Candidatus Kerfeldbacteria bacterium CG_4_10_14_0_8_um_filter_42_10]|uniref:Uncharacterized protein n=1 Tax=Candidatus Kerfeldbacteria bacterium CG_4_10_14_0_8_um_filter_42_10 TaxID=2014248 RepID=A0A2M7RGT4_9BACT|nr:MAG: hypothetical protein COY66_05535 [Candidatus Kerfeldbacteria bacterium CG_4_10_14_0_8_um_filter_42_10]
MKSKNGKILKIILVNAFVLFGLFSYTKTVEAVSINNLSFPRLANYFLKTPISEEEAEALAQWDIVILGMQAQDTDPEVFDILRKGNPDIIILAYVAPVEFPVARLGILESANGPWHKLNSGIDEDWWLYEAGGDHVSFWPGNWAMNITDDASLASGERWNTYFPKFLEEEIMATGNWDGIFFDSVWDTAAWVNNGDMDFDQDGLKESAAEINAKWNAGMAKIFSETRKRIGDDAILIGNGGDSYKNYLNGRMFENYPDENNGGWETQTPQYFSFMNEGQTPRVSIIGANTQNSGHWNDFKDMRFALTSTLLHDGFFSYDWGTENHGQLWWYDEFNIPLGEPLSEAQNISSNSSELQEGLWRRDFQYGIVLTNSTPDTQTYQLEATFEKYEGTQDDLVNSGELVTSVTLSGNDGIILLRKLDLIIDSPFYNNSPVKVFDSLGNETRHSFYSYSDKVPIDKLTEIVDLDGDGTNEIVYASGNRIYLKNNNGTDRTSFLPYSQVYTGDVSFTVGDIDGDNKPEIVTGTGQGGGPHVRIFSNTGVLENPGFFAYASNVRHGVRVGIGDLNNDGKREIITGPGFGAGPHVRIFEGSTGRLLSAGFFAYDERIRIGVNIAIGDVDGDNKAEIVTGAGPGGGPHIRIFDSQGELDRPGFFAYSELLRSGINIAVMDVDGDGSDEILAYL